MSEDQIFADALELADPGQRAAFLREACGSDDRLLRRVQTLLAAHDRAGAFMNRPAAELAVDSVGTATIHQIPPDPAPEKTGDRIGPYELIERIGEGGMGVIYRARQTAPVRRDVALKIIRPGLESHQFALRFQLECQALAAMDHPCIAKVFDAGVTDSGRPYFTMELVHGSAITEFSQDRLLALDDRLDLFVQVCDAIQHAHRRGIIHRDIKPSNILVSDDGGSISPKVVDFGVAKALAPEWRPADRVTRVGQIMGTPQYMSPEQAEVSGDRVDSRTDVYSLGAVLYELLTGSTPIAAERFAEGSWVEVFRAVREAEPVTPSERLRAHTTIVDGADRPPATTIQVAALRGELDWIVMKALEKEPERRYQTPADLADDIGRYLAGLPVEAGRPSLTYRLRKVAARHRAAIAVSAFLLAVLVGAAVFSTWQAVVATRAQRSAIAEAQRARDAELAANENLQESLVQKEAAIQAQRKAERIKEYLVDAFGSPVPQRDGASVTVLEVLERATARIGEDFQEDPETQADLLLAMATTYAGLGQYRRALELCDQSVALYESARGVEAFETLRARARRGHVRSMSSDDLEAAIVELHQVAEGLERLPADVHRRDLAYARRIVLQSYVAAGRVRDAETLAEQVVAQHIDWFGTESLDTAEARNLAARVLYEQARHEDAAMLWALVVARFNDELGDDNARTQSATMNLASCYLTTGRDREGVEMLEQLLPVNQATFGPEHPSTLNTMTNLATGYAKTGRMEQAAEFAGTALELHRKVHGDSHLLTIQLMSNLARMHTELARYDTALALFDESVTRARGALGAEHPQLADSLNLLSELQVRRRQFDAAIDAADESIRIRMIVYGADHPSTLASQYALARAYNHAGRIDQALEVAAPAVRRWIELFGDGDPRTLAARAQYAIIQQRAGAHADAATQLVAILRARRAQGKSDTELLPLQKQLATCILSMRNQADAHSSDRQMEPAEALLVAAHAAAEHLSGGTQTHELRTGLFQSFIRLYDAWGRTDQRDRWLRRLEEYSTATPAPDRPTDDSPRR